MDDETTEAFVNTIAGEPVCMKQSIARVEEALKGQVVTRQMPEKLIGPAGLRGSCSKIERDP